MKIKWWLWLLIALICLAITFGVFELADISIGSIFGWGVLGVLGTFVTIVTSIFLAMIAFLIAYTLKLLLGKYISNGVNLYFTLGIFGFCVILVGYILATIDFKWSILIMAVGFFLGWLSGMEYQKTQIEHEQLENELFKRRREETDSAMKAMSTEDLLALKKKYSDDAGITDLVDKFLEKRE